MARLLFILLLLPYCLLAKTIEVFPNQNAETIHLNITIASPHDTIYFHDGHYKLHDILILKPMTLLGGSKAILDGEEKHEILLISADSVTLSGLTFKNSGYSSLHDFAAIKVINANHVVIENNHILGSYFAIHISNAAYGVIRNNTIEGKSISEQLNGNAIHIWKSNHMIITQNTISRHRDGIYLEFVTHSMITDNFSSLHMRYGLHFMFSNDDVYTCNTFFQNGAGVAVMYSKRVKMEENHFKNNWGPSAYGLLLKDISDSEISSNHFEENTKGIHMEGTSRIKLFNNNFIDNGWGVVLQASCESNLFQHNNFMGNSFDISTNGQVTLNTFQYNYWDEYEGYDLNKEGVGDIPYHPLSLFALLIEQNPSLLILVKSFMMQLLEKMERAIPSLTPDLFVDTQPLMKPFKND